MIKAGPSDDTDAQINVIVNWRQELLARLPAQ
jgi:hypothetical protein